MYRHGTLLLLISPDILLRMSGSSNVIIINSVDIELIPVFKDTLPDYRIAVKLRLPLIKHRDTNVYRSIDPHFKVSIRYGKTAVHLHRISTDRKLPIFNRQEAACDSEPVWNLLE